MKKIYFTLFLLLLCTASVFSTQMYNNAAAKQSKSVAPAPKKDSTGIISGMISLPSFR